MVTQRINLNLIPGGVLPRINVSQYDTGSRTLELVIYNGESAFSIPAGSNIQIVGTKRDNTGFEYSCTFSGNVVSVDVTDQMTVFPGEVVTEIRILKDGDQLGSGNFIINVEPTALKDDVVISETDIPIIQQLPTLISQAESAAELAHQWADYGDESDTPSATNNAKYWSIQAAAAAAGCLRPAIVPSLPTSDISTVTLYFVPSSDPDTGNLYDEYINTDGTSAGWELIGSTGVDLSAYLQKTGDSKDNTVTYTSADDDTVFNTGNLGGQSAYAWTAANSLASGEKHSVLFNKVSTMLKNLRTIAKLIGTADISTIGTSPNTGTVTGAIAKLNSDLSELGQYTELARSLTTGTHADKLLSLYSAMNTFVTDYPTEISKLRIRFSNTEFVCTYPGQFSTIVVYDDGVTVGTYQMVIRVTNSSSSCKYFTSLINSNGAQFFDQSSNSDVNPFILYYYK